MKPSTRPLVAGAIILWAAALQYNVSTLSDDERRAITGDSTVNFVLGSSSSRAPSIDASRAAPSNERIEWALGSDTARASRDALCVARAGARDDGVERRTER